MEDVTSGTEIVRVTEQEAQTNVHAVLQLCAGGKLRCNETTRRPTAATITAVAGVLSAGDFLPDDAIAPSPGHCCYTPVDWLSRPGIGCS